LRTDEGALPIEFAEQLIEVLPPALPGGDRTNG